MKVIISCLNSKYVHASLSPWCLLAGVNKFCKSKVTATVLESTINSDLDNFVEQIPKATVYAFSCYIWNIQQTLYVCQKLKEKFKCKIVVGGPEVAYRAAQVLEQYSYIDFVLSGEGEFNLPKLIDVIAFSLPLQQVDGLSYREDKNILLIPEQVYSITPPNPYCKEFFAALKGRICYIETSRGCPYRCAFCLSGRCGALKYFDINTVKQNILLLANSSTKTIKFVDRTFNANSKRANEILNFIKDNYGNKIPKGVCFHFEIAGDILTDETLDVLSQMPIGAVQLEIGMQSFNEDTLKLINRKTDTQKLIKNIKKLLSFKNMHIHIDLIAGLTGEDMQSFRYSFNTGYNLYAHMLQMGFLKLLYGSNMRQNADKYPCEYSPNPPYEVISTPWLTKNEIVALKKCEDALERLYNSGRFLFTLDYLINEIVIEPFKVFFDFGNVECGNGVSLSDYTQKLYDFYKDKCDSEILREKIVCDMLCCSAEKHIPDSLKIKDTLYKKVKIELSKTYGNNFAFALLYKSKKIFVVKNGEPCNLYGRKKGAFLDF